MEWFFAVLVVVVVVGMIVMGIHDSATGKRFEQRTCWKVLKDGDIIENLTEVSIRNPKLEELPFPGGAAYCSCVKAYHCTFVGSNNVAVFQTSNENLKVNTTYRIKKDKIGISFQEYSAE